MSQHPRTPTQFIPAAEALPVLIEALPAGEHYAAQFQFTQERQAAFLRRLADCGEIRAAAKASSVSHQTVYRHRRACPIFRQACQAARLIARELAEDALATRAMNGVEEQVFYHGEVVAMRRRHDTRLLLAHLGRLDRLGEQEDVAAVVGNFDALLEALEAGDEDAALAMVEPGFGSGIFGGVGEDEVSSPGQCNMRSKSQVESQAEHADMDLCLERRLAAMDAARPDDAKALHTMARSVDDLDLLEAAQLAAFEAGEERWWEVNPLGRDEFKFNPRMAGGDQADLLSRAARQVNRPAGDEGAAIVDAHGDGAPVACVGDTDHGAKGQRLVSRRHGAHVETLSIGGAAAVEAATVIGCDTSAEIA